MLSFLKVRVVKSKIGYLALGLFLVSNNTQAQDILDTPITISIEHQSVETVLYEISTLGNLNFVYSSDLVDVNKVVSIHSSNQPIKDLLDRFLGNEYEYLARGKYIILHPTKKEKKGSFQFKGEVTDAYTGKKIGEATIYEANRLNSSISDKKGGYELRLNKKPVVTTLIFSKKNYQDTVIQFSKVPTNPIQVQLKPLLMPTIEPNTANIDSTKIVRFFVNEQHLKNVKNIPFLEQRPFQLSLVPVVGTNKLLGGSISNDVSLNIIAGYAYGIEGIEIGGATNMVRRDVKGVQLGGAGNIVGGDVNGLQAGGAINTSKGSVIGVQLGGLLNHVSKSTTGVQLSGLWNHTKQKMQGVQVSGLLNTATAIKGVQITGLINIAKKEDSLSIKNNEYFDTLRSSKTDIPVFNITKKSKFALQIAGLANTNQNEIRGLQISSIFNKGIALKGGQISGILNSVKDVKGIQVTGLINIARKVKGLQLGIINIADTLESGATIGLINLVKNGLTNFEIASSDVMPIGFSFKSGTNRLYSILHTGISPSPELWSYGLGIGTEFRLGQKFYTSLEATFSEIHPLDRFHHNTNHLYRLLINFGYKLGKNISLNTGPTYNIYVSSVYNAETDTFGDDLGSSGFYERINNGRLLKMWIGYQAAFRF
ncbi:MAG: STN domain-containing protein [Bacteroidota bacterium]